MEYFTELGYIGLFFASFLAATILPLSSEVVLGVLLLNNFDPVTLVFVATAGNVIGSFINYLIGFWGGIYLVKKILRVSEKEFENAKHRFNKYGVFSLFFAWVPIIGDPLTVVAGILKINLPAFFLLVTLGKFLRYLIISYAFI
ncbi:MAG: DedA family protein [Melioribacteraceae bacterium]|nr:DedA family protein [Melioribacteraceae bacterium]